MSFFFFFFFFFFSFFWFDIAVLFDLFSSSADVFHEKNFFLIFYLQIALSVFFFFLFFFFTLPKL